MPSYYPENNNPRPSDDPQRSLQKINGILVAGGGAVVSGNPVVETAKASTTALAANSNRKRAFIQNNGTNVLFVKEGSGCSTSSFSASLNAASVADNGTGGSYNILTTAIITIAGTSPRYSVTEIT